METVMSYYQLMMRCQELEARVTELVEQLHREQDYHVSVELEERGVA